MAGAFSTFDNEKINVKSIENFPDFKYLFLDFFNQTFFAGGLKSFIWDFCDWASG